MRIGIVTDEISPNIREAIKLGMDWGIQDFEFRTSQSGRVPEISTEDFNALLECQRDYGIRITALSPGTFKIPVDDRAGIHRDLHGILPTTLALAQKFHTPTVITFGFIRSPRGTPDEFSRAVQILTEAAKLAELEGITLAVENEPGFLADTGENTANLLSAVSSKALRANWDPGNALGAQPYPFPDGYAFVKPWIANMHVKDTEKDSTLACVPIGEGKIDWEGQLRAVVADGILTHVTIETHCLPLIENSKKNVETVKRLLKNIENEVSKKSE
jgi:sugar phosphate isomerase/epimerase